jgi:hypothetical protein
MDLMKTAAVSDGEHTGGAMAAMLSFLFLATAFFAVML